MVFNIFKYPQAFCTGHLLGCKQSNNTTVTSQHSYILSAIVEMKTINDSNSSARNKDQKLVGRFLRKGYFIDYYNVVPLEMHGKFGQLK